MRTAFVLSVLVGCSESDPDGASVEPADACLSRSLQVDAGSGTTFSSLHDGDAVTLVHGPQGGWHVDVAGEVFHTGELVEISSRLVDPIGVQVAGDQTATRLALVDWNEEDCSGQFSGLRVFVDDGTEPVTQSDICALAGARMELTLTVTALGETRAATAVETVEVVAALDPNDVEVCGGR